MLVEKLIVYNSNKDKYSSFYIQNRLLIVNIISRRPLVNLKPPKICLISHGTRLTEKQEEIFSNQFVLEKLTKIRRKE
ncbi:hypothetical protein BpHYR1_047637 [Brachionus plicatilis]|uniref:Uncharacterized protein n=1 Tax=Brachionus plicatilis TaxID=10195 RepID=A0A3M7PGS9_BRAPC|nr:hypothetical protein BpHYR1_047637 [Brachionus plicatilis]